MKKNLVQILFTTATIAIVLLFFHEVSAQEPTQTTEPSIATEPEPATTTEPKTATTTEPEPATTAEPATAPADWKKEIAQVGEEFKSLYESANAEALSVLFTETGEFIDSERVVYSGRKDIQTEFAAMFEETSGSKMELVVDSARQVADSVVVEDGHAWIQDSNGGSTTVSQYCTVLVKQGDEWKIASLRDIKSEFATPGDRLDSLDWLIGEWIDESDAAVVEYEFDWSEDNNFILGSFEFRSSDEDDFSGTVRIGWDAGSKQFKSWTFDSEGGVSVGHWNPIDEGWIIKTTGTRSDGVSGSSSNYYQRVDDGRVLWKSFDRHVGGEKQPDVEVTLVRKPPAPGAEESGASEHDESEESEKSEEGGENEKSEKSEDGGGKNNR